MTVKNAILAGLVAVGLSMGGPLVGLAQDSGLVDETAEVAERNPEDNWLKVCSNLEDGRKACIMRQVVTNAGIFVGSFLLRDDPSQDSRLLAVGSVPVGVILPANMSWQIDGAKPVRVPYMLCDPNACSAQTVINEAFVQALKRGAKLSLTYTNRQFEPVVVDINLAGFTAVYDDPEGIDIDELNQANSTENVLEQVLQDRAQQLRQQLEQNGDAEAAPAEPAEGEPAEEAPAQ